MKVGENLNKLFLSISVATKWVNLKSSIKMLAAAQDKGEAIKKAKQTAFYKHTGFKTAPSHVDDKFGVGVDDAHEINDILSPGLKNKCELIIWAAPDAKEDEIHVGYFKLDRL